MITNKSTIQSIIEEGKENRLTSHDLSFKNVIEDSVGNKFVVNMSSIFDKYYDTLLQHAVVAILSEDDYLKYRYKPKVLSKDIYGTMDLHFLLLRLNNITSVTQFDFREVKVFTNDIVRLLNEIVVLEYENYTDNEIDVIKKMNE